MTDLRDYLLVFRADYRGMTTILVALIIGTNAWSMIPEMNTGDHYPDYYLFMAPYLFSCDPWEIPHRGDNPTRNPLAWWLKCLSFNYTDSHKTFVLPFAIGLMPLVYLLGTYLTNDRIVGLLGLVAFTYNPLYTDWATNGTYDQVWAFFLVLSFVLLARNRGTGSAFSIITAGLGKFMSILYLPVWFLMARKHPFAIATMIMLVTAGIILVHYLDINIVGNSIGFYPEHAEQAVFRNISLFWQVLPALFLFVGLPTMLRVKTIFKTKKLVLFFILWTFLLTPLVHLFSEQLTFSYRYAPFAAFMSVYIGMAIVETGTHIVDSRFKMTKTA